MNAIDYVDKIIIEYDHRNNSNFGFQPIVIKYLGHIPKLTNPEDCDLIKEIQKIIAEFDYGASTSKQGLFYDVSPTFLEAKKHGGHFRYQAYLKEEENKKGLYKDNDKRKKWYETQIARDVFDNYPKVKKRANWALWLAIFVAILEVLHWIIRK